MNNSNNNVVININRINIFINNIIDNNIIIIIIDNIVYNIITNDIDNNIIIVNNNFIIIIDINNIINSNTGPLHGPCAAGHRALRALHLGLGPRWARWHGPMGRTTVSSRIIVIIFNDSGHTLVGGIIDNNHIITDRCSIRKDLFELNTCWK